MLRTTISAFGLPGRSFDPLAFVLCPFALLTGFGAGGLFGKSPLTPLFLRGE